MPFHVLRFFTSQLADKVVLRFSTVVNRVSSFQSWLLFFFFFFFTAVLIPFFVLIAIVSCKNRLIKFLGKFFL